MFVNPVFNLCQTKEKVDYFTQNRTKKGKSALEVVLTASKKKKN
jgi:hypothetical protein